MCLCAWKHKAAGDTDRVARSPRLQRAQVISMLSLPFERDFPIPSRQRWHVSGRRPADLRAGKPLQSFFLNFSPSLVLTPSVGLFFWGRGGLLMSIVRVCGVRGNGGDTHRRWPRRCNDDNSAKKWRLPENVKEWPIKTNYLAPADLFFSINVPRVDPNASVRRWLWVTKHVRHNTSVQIFKTKSLRCISLTFIDQNDLNKRNPFFLDLFTIGAAGLSKLSLFFGLMEFNRSFF